MRILGYYHKFWKSDMREVWWQPNNRLLKWVKWAKGMYNANRLPIACIIFATFIVGIILHELIHGLTWSLFAKNGFKSMTFGILLKMLTPYCHCKEPLKVKQYVIGAIMPSIILGLIPTISAIILGSIILFIFGIFFTIVALGDFMIINLLKNENKNSYVLDHPTEAGCFIYREK